MMSDTKRGLRPDPGWPDSTANIAFKAGQAVAQAEIDRLRLVLRRIAVQASEGIMRNPASPALGTLAEIAQEAARNASE